MLGQTISHYRVTKKLGQGGMGEVYLAEDIRLGHSVAIKKLPHHLATDRQLRIRFQREAKAVANLRHPYIVPLYEYDEIEGELYLITEYLPGGSLRDVIMQRPGAIPVENVLRWGIQAAEGLAEAHGRGILHRDIKPDNLLLTEKGDLRIADFGLVRLEGETQMTEAGSTLGTLAYMPPEQLRGEEPGPSGDLYALGATLYELLTGKPAFRGTNRGAIIRSVLEDDPTPLDATQPGLPAQLTALIDDLLEKDAQARPASAEDVAAHLRQIAIEQDLSATMPLPVVGSSRAPRRFAWWHVVLITILLGVGVTLVQRIRTTDGTPEEDPFTRVAVMPFAIRGAQDYLHEGMVDLLSAQLDGMGSLRSVDKNVLLSKIDSDISGQMNPSSAADLADDLGAQLFVLGDVFGAGEKIVLTASLYDFGENDAALATANVEGAIHDILELVDRLALQLIGDRIEDLGDGPSSYTSLNTESYDALKSFLEGERLFRTARFIQRGTSRSSPEGIETVEAYRRAVEADSTFALAWLRLAESAGTFIGHPSWREQKRAMETALRLRDQLSRHDRLLMEAGNGLSQFGIDCCGEFEYDFQRVERQYLDIIREWPGDFQAWYGLAMARRMFNWRVGRNPREAKEPLDRALEVDPEGWRAMQARYKVAALERDYDTYDRLLNRVYAGMKASAEARAISVFTVGDRAEQEQLLSELKNESHHLSVWSSMNLAWATEDLDLAKQIAQFATAERHKDDGRAVGHVLLAHLALARGRWAEARREFARATELERSYGLEHLALTAGMPMFAVEEAELREIRAELANWDPATLVLPEDPDPWKQVPEDRDLRLQIHDHLHPVLKVYLLGLLDLRLGNLDAAASSAEAMFGMTSLPTVPMYTSPNDSFLVKDLAHGLRAQVAWANGDLESALTEFESTVIASRQGQTYTCSSSFYFQSLERFLRAELLREMGRHEQALGWYSGFGWDWGYEFMYLAPLNLRMAEIYEQMGEPEKALEHYELFVGRWKDCDAHLRPLVDEARARMAALQG